jgi:branched-chain amino acid transport system ATP-binding protein
VSDTVRGPASSTGPAEHLLAADSVTVRFSGVLALDQASLHVDAGRVTGLIGPNGAGKTTLFNVITGLQWPNQGRVLLDGKDVTRAKPHKRARRGIARTFQRLEAFGTLTARENVLVALEMRRRWWPERYSPPALADELLAQIGITGVADVKVEALPTGTARLVEVARALAVAPKVLLLDEPSSGLDDRETAALGQLLVQLAGDGLGILLVEHDMAFVMDTCAHINVLDFGRVIARGAPHEVQADPAVQQAYLGTKAAAP